MRILLVHNSFRSFVRIDRDIISSRHEVDEMDLSAPARVATLPARLPRADLVYCWFASLHSFLPAIGAAALRKPVVSVVGAYDAASEPGIDFGHMRHPWKKHVVRSVCNVSTLLICNSDYAVETVRRNVRPRTSIRRLHHGFHFADRPLLMEKDPIALSIGLIRRENLMRKGHEVFALAAALVPEVRFILAGKILDDAATYLRSIAPPNFELRDHLPDSELEELYDRASVYVQPSAHESFGMSVVEAMGAGEIAVVSRRGALPEIVGEHGVFVDERDPESVAQGIRRALASPAEARAAGAEYVRERFPMSKRRDGLLEALEQARRGVSHGRGP